MNYVACDCVFQILEVKRVKNLKTRFRTQVCSEAGGFNVLPMFNETTRSKVTNRKSSGGDTREIALSPRKPSNADWPVHKVLPPLL